MSAIAIRLPESGLAGYDAIADVIKVAQVTTHGCGGRGARWMRVLGNVDSWIEQWAIRDEVAREERAYWKLFLPNASFWKLFGTFIVPSALLSLTLEATFGDRVSAAFQLFGGALLSSAFFWRFLGHRNAFRAQSAPTETNTVSRQE